MHIPSAEEIADAACTEIDAARIIDRANEILTMILDENHGAHEYAPGLGEAAAIYLGSMFTRNPTLKAVDETMSMAERAILVNALVALLEAVREFGPQLYIVHCEPEGE